MDGRDFVVIWQAAARSLDGASQRTRNDVAVQPAMAACSNSKNSGSDGLIDAVS